MMNYTCQVIKYLLNTVVKDGHGFPLYGSECQKLKCFVEVYFEPSRTSTMEIFCENS